MIKRNKFAIPYLLKRKWNSILAGLFTIGFIFAYYIPPTKKLLGGYSWDFLFVGIAAILWTLIELKANLLPDMSPGDRFNNLRSARGDIVKRIMDAIKSDPNQKKVIQIIGGRLRTISGIITDVVAAITDGELSCRNVEIVVCCLKPTFVSLVPDKQSFETFKQNADYYKKLIEASLTTFETYNNSEMFKKESISIKVIPNQDYPSVYAFLINNRELFWGFYTWDFDKQDFVGPSNPCYYLNNKLSLFSEFNGWLSNKVSYFEALGK